MFAADAVPLELRQYRLADFHLPFIADAERMPPLGLIPLAPGATFAEPPPPSRSYAIDPAVILEFIQRTVAPSSWGKDGASIDNIGDDLLVVQATPTIQACVVQALTALGALSPPCGLVVDFGTLPGPENASRLASCPWLRHNDYANACVTAPR